MPSFEDMPSQEASVESEKTIEEMKKKIEVLERTMEEQRLRAERDAQGAGKEGGAGGGTRGEGTAGRQQAASTVPTPGLEARSGMSLPSLYRPSLSQSRPPKFDNVEAHFSMWRSKFLAYLSSLGCLHVLSSTANPVMVGFAGGISLQTFPPGD